MAVDALGGNLNLKTKKIAQQITLKPNIIKVKKIIADFPCLQHLQSNLNELTGYMVYIYYKIMV